MVLAVTPTQQERLTTGLVSSELAIAAEAQEIEQLLPPDLRGVAGVAVAYCWAEAWAKAWAEASAAAWAAASAEAWERARAKAEIGPEVTLRIRGENDEPSPVKIGVEIDGSRVGIIEFAKGDNSLTWESLSMTVPRSFTLRLVFLNGFFEGSEERYGDEFERVARLDKIEINGLVIEAEDFDRDGTEAPVPSIREGVDRIKPYKEFVNGYGEDVLIELADETDWVEYDISLAAGVEVWAAAWADAWVKVGAQAFAEAWARAWAWAACWARASAEARAHPCAAAGADAWAGAIAFAWSEAAAAAWARAIAEAEAEAWAIAYAAAWGWPVYAEVWAEAWAEAGAVAFAAAGAVVEVETWARAWAWAAAAAWARRCAAFAACDWGAGARAAASAWARAWSYAYAEAWADAWADAWARAVGERIRTVAFEWANSWVRTWADTWSYAWADTWAFAWAGGGCRTWVEECPECRHLCPDLIPTELRVREATGIEFCDITLEATVKNQGDAPAGSFIVDLYLDGRKIHSSTVESLAEGTTKKIFAWVTRVEGGEYVVRVDVDPEDTVPECNEENNRRDWRIEVWAHTEEELERCIEDCWERCYEEHWGCVAECEEEYDRCIEAGTPEEICEKELDECVAVCDWRLKRCKGFCEIGCESAFICTVEVEK